MVLDGRVVTAVSAGGLAVAAGVAVVVRLALSAGPRDLTSPEAAVRASCQASHVLLQNEFNGDLRYVDWQSKVQTPTGAGWTALVRVDSAGARVLDCKHSHFTRFPMSG